MSDMSQGPGWWIASDGKWYPPHLHPSVRVPDPSEAPSQSAPSESAPSQSAPSESAPSESAPSESAPSESAPPESAPWWATQPEAAPGASPWEGTQPEGMPSQTMAPAMGRKRSRAPLAIAVSVGVVLLLVVGGVVMFGGSQSASAEVVNAANSAIGSKTAHMTLNLTVTTRGVSVTGSGSGNIDFANNDGSLQFSIEAAGTQITAKEIFIGGVIYENIPSLASITGKPWLSVDLSSLEHASDGNPSGDGVGNNPAAVLRILAQQGNTVVSLGPSTVDGVAVNGYLVKENAAAIMQRVRSAQLPSWMQQVLSQLQVANARLTVYIDGSGMLRSMDMSATESVAGSGSVATNVAMDFSDYGAPLSVSPPPADQVESFQQFLQTAGSSLPSS
jgi:hypothetical protein